MAGKNNLIAALAPHLINAAISAGAGFFASRAAKPAAPDAPPPPVLLSNWRQRHPTEAGEIDAANARAIAAENRLVKMEKKQKYMTPSIAAAVASVAAIVVPAIASNIPILRELMTVMCSALITPVQ